MSTDTKPGKKVGVSATLFLIPQTYEVAGRSRVEVMGTLFLGEFETRKTEYVKGTEHHHPRKKKSKFFTSAIR
jgi:hypothetical protein